MSGTTAEINHWEETIEPSVLEQYKESTNWLGILKASIDRFQDLETALAEFKELFNIEYNLSGSRLDWLCSLVNIRRMDYEDDDHLRERFNLCLGNHKAGTPDYVISQLVKTYGAVNPVYFEESPATFFVYTPEGRQLSRAMVKKLRPTGVNGLPAAALKTASGKFIVTTRYDENFVDDVGNQIVDDLGNEIVFVEKESKKILCVARDENIGKTKSKIVLTEDGKRVITEEGFVVRTEA